LSTLDDLPRFSSDPAGDAAARAGKWQRALTGGKLPDFVRSRLEKAGAGKTPWMSTMTPAELLLARGLGIRPVTMVSGTCWFCYRVSWTTGHVEGWHLALDRMKREALAAGANAIVDVKLRTISLEAEESMDFTVIGTAVKLDGLPPSSDPVVATVSAIEFVRLLKEGIVPTGVAIGADYNLLDPFLAGNPLPTYRWETQPLGTLGDFWRRIRVRAAQALREDTKRMGDGVLAHTEFSQLLKAGKEGSGEDRKAGFVGRCILIGTAVQCKTMDNVIGKFKMVLDMRDDLSPLNDAVEAGHNVYPVDDDRDRGGI
jgi:hypothetical protein